MTQARSHYENLKVARNAPLEVIRAAYKALAQKYHPDRNQSDREASRIMAVVNEAYRVLSDTKLRQQHDDWLQQMELIHYSQKQETSSFSAQQEAPGTSQESQFCDEATPKNDSVDLERVYKRFTRLLPIIGAVLGLLALVLVFGFHR